MGKATTEGGSGSVTYYTIAGGDIVNRVPEGTEGAIPHTITKGPNEGKVVWDMHNNAIPGVITGGGIVVVAPDWLAPLIFTSILLAAMVKIGTPTSSIPSALAFKA